MNTPLRVLIVEDSEDDALLIIMHLRRGGYEPEWKRVQSTQDLASALNEKNWDLILSDFRLPGFNGIAALEQVKNHGQDIPFILISGVVGEEQAVAAMKAGAQDYLLKDNLARLVPAVERELREAEIRRQRRLAEQKLRENEAQFRSIFELAAIGMAQAVPATGRLLRVNDKFCEITGYSREELLEKNLTDCVHPDDRETDEKKFAEAARGATSDYRNEKRYIRKDGELVWVDANATFVRDTDGNAVTAIAAIEDITTRKKSEQALRRAKEEWERTFDSVPDLIAVLDEHHRIVRANRAMAERLRLSPRQCIGQVCYSGVHASNSPPANCPHSLTIQDGREHTAEVHEDALGGDFLVSTTPLRDESGKLIGAVHVARDITQRKRMEESLRASESRLRTLGDNLPDGALFRYAQDPTGQSHFEFVSAGIQRLTGVSAAEAIANADVLLGTMLLEDRQRMEAAAAQSRETLTPFEIEVRERNRETGELRWALLRAVPQRRPDGSTMWEGVHLDITQRMLAEEALRENRALLHAVIEGTSDAIFIKDPEGRYLLCNATTAAYLGRQVSDVLGNDDTLFFPPEQARKVRNQDLAAIAAGKPIGSVETITISGDDTPRTFHSTKGPLFDAEGHVTGVFGISRDITTLKRAEDALRRSNARLDLLAETASELLKSNSPQSVIERLCRKIMDFLGCEVFFNFLSEEHEERLHLNAFAGIPPEEAKRIEWLTLAEATSPDWCRGYGFRACVSHSLMSQGCTLGTLSFGSLTRANFSDDEISLMKAVADQVAIAVLRQQTEQALRESEERLANFAKATFEGIIFSERGRIIDCNEQFAKLTGYTIEELKGKQIEDMLPAEDRGRVVPGIRNRADNVIEHQIVRKDASRIIVEAQGRSHGRQRQTVIRDITEHRRREEELKQINRTLKALSDSNQAIMRATDETSYLQEVCRIVTEDCGHAMVWVGMCENDTYKSVRPIAHAGFDEGYLETLHVSWADTERGRGPTGMAVRTRSPQSCSNMLTDPAFEPWRKEALKRGYCSSLALPLISADRAFGVITIYSRFPAPFSEKEVQLLSELAADIAYGIDALRLREAIRQSEARERARATEFETIFQTVPIGLSITHDPEGKNIRGNPALEKLLGLSGNAELSKNSLNANHAGYRVLRDGREVSYMELPMQKAARGQIVAGQTLDVEREDGTMVKLFSNAAPLFDETGQPRGAVGAFLDITELSRTQEALRTANERLHSILSSITDSFFVLDSDLRFLEINKSAENQYFHRAAADLLGKRLLDEFPKVETSEFYRQYQMALRECRPLHFEAKSLLADKWFEAHIYPRDGRLEVYLRDISERKRAEEVLQRLNSELEQRVRLRTAELEDTSVQLAGRVKEMTCLYRASRLLAENEHLPQANLLQQLADMLPGACQSPEIVAARVAIGNIDVRTSNFAPTKWSQIANFSAGDDRGIIEIVYLSEQNAAKTPFQAEERWLISTLAEMLKTDLERRRAIAALRDREQRMRMVLEQLPAVLWTTDSQLIVTSASGAGLAAAGLRTAELVGEHLSRAGHLLRDPHADGTSEYERALAGEHVNFESHSEDRIFDCHLEPFADARGHVAGVIGVALDVTTHRMLEKQILSVVEREQQRIGQDLHDGVCQELAGVAFLADAMAQDLAAKKATEAEVAKKMALILKDSAVRARHLSRGLVPVEVDAQGLMMALQQLAERAQLLFKLRCHFKCEKPVLIEDSITATHLYRIAQEAVQNSARHGKAQQVTIALEPTGRALRLMITDDGVGIGKAPSEGKGIGLENMRYRARIIGASLEIAPRGARQRGTKVVCNLPYLPQPKTAKKAATAKRKPKRSA